MAIYKNAQLRLKAAEEKERKDKETMNQVDQWGHIVREMTRTYGRLG